MGMEQVEPIEANLQETPVQPCRCVQVCWPVYVHNLRELEELDSMRYALEYVCQKLV